MVGLVAVTLGFAFVLADLALVLTGFVLVLVDLALVLTGFVLVLVDLALVLTGFVLVFDLGLRRVPPGKKRCISPLLGDEAAVLVGLNNMVLGN